MIRYIQNINFQQILQTTTWFWFYINDRTLKVTTLRILYSKLWDMVNREHYEYYQHRHSIKSLTLLQKCLGLYQVYSKSNTNECLVQLSTYKVSKNLSRTLSNTYVGFLWENIQSFKPLIIFAQNSISDVWQVSQYASPFEW